MIESWYLPPLEARVQLVHIFRSTTHFFHSKINPNCLANVPLVNQFPWKNVGMVVSCSVSGQSNYFTFDQFWWNAHDLHVSNTSWEGCESL